MSLPCTHVVVTIVMYFPFVFVDGKGKEGVPTKKAFKASHFWTDSIENKTVLPELYVLFLYYFYLIFILFFLSFLSFFIFFYLFLSFIFTLNFILKTFPSFRKYDCCNWCLQIRSIDCI